MNNPPEEVIRDAKSVAYGIFRMNAEYASKYGFTVAANNREVDYGEFLGCSESEDHVDWILELSNGNVRPAKRSGYTA